MAITIGWRKKDGKVEEKSFLGTEVPEGWFDNPRLEPNTVVQPEEEKRKPGRPKKDK